MWWVKLNDEVAINDVVMETDDGVVMIDVSVEADFGVMSTDMVVDIDDGVSLTDVAGWSESYDHHVVVNNKKTSMPNQTASHAG